MRKHILILTTLLLLMAACGGKSTITPAPTAPPLPPAATAVTVPDTPEPTATRPGATAGEVCGDGSCVGTENALNCPQDCPAMTPLAPYPLGEPAVEPLAPYPLASEQRCGDGVCDGPENGALCPQDCAPGAYPLPGEPAGETAPLVPRVWVINPSSGAHLWVELLQPADAGSEPRPTIVLVPGGSGAGQDFLDESGQKPDRLLAAGYNVMVFDPDGRGQSEGMEDYDGFVQQDGLAAVILYTASLPEVDPARIGVASFSYGVTMAAGALARYPELPVRFLIDFEGPANRNDTGGCDAAHLGHLAGVASCDDEAFWAQREALTFISQVPVPYQRIQTATDHVQPDLAHAIAMVNAAVQGASPWVRLNDLPPNQIYDPAAPPAMLPDEQDGRVMKLIVDYADQLLARP